MTSVHELGLFDRLYWPKGAHPKERYHPLGRFTEWYFDVGQKRYQVKKDRSGDTIPVEPVKSEKASLGQVIAKVMTCFFKILTYMTVVIPLLMFVAKLIYRSSNDFEIFKKGGYPGNNGNEDDVEVSSRQLTPSAVVSRPKRTAVTPAPRRPVHRGNKSVVQRYVNTDFFEEVVAQRIGRLAERVDQIEIVDKAGLTTMYRLYVDLISQELNLRLIFEHHGNYLEPEQVEYLTVARDGINDQIHKLSEKAKSCSRVLEVFKEIEDNLKSAFEKVDRDKSSKVDIEAVEEYLTFANLLEKLEVKASVHDQKTYDGNIYDRAERYIKPMPIRNYGNTCYLNSALQVILAIPHFKERICSDQWRSKTLTRYSGETDAEYAVRSAKHTKNFNADAAKLKSVHSYFKALCTAFEKRDQPDINQAVRNLNQAFAKARCFDGAIGRQHDAIQPIETLLSAIDYAFETKMKVRYTPLDAAQDIEKNREFPQQQNQFIRLMMKDYVGDEPYATSFQGLLNHQFSELTIHERTRIDEDPIAVRHELTKLQNIEDYLVVKLERTGQCRQKASGRIIEGRHPEEIKFTEGEIIDFSSAFEPSLIATGEEVLYEVVAVANHHGQTNRGGHWTAHVKRGGKWYVCDDSSPIRTIGMSNPLLGNGSIYVFKRIINNKGFPNGN